MIINQLQKILATIAFLFGFGFLFYRKGKKDLQSDKIKDMVQEYEKKNKLKNEIEKLSHSQSNAFAAKLRQNNNN